jgi:uncharacterized protein DUF4157
MATDVIRPCWRPTSDAAVELAAVLGDASWQPASVQVHAGRLAHWLTCLCRARGVTLGRHVFLERGAIVRNGEHWEVDGPLLAHECAHACQYARLGAPRFLFLYVRDWLRALRRQPRWDRSGRHAAYLAIGLERDARAAALLYGTVAGARRATLRLDR